MCPHLCCRWLCCHLFVTQHTILSQLLLASRRQAGRVHRQRTELARRVLALERAGGEQADAAARQEFQLVGQVQRLEAEARAAGMYVLVLRCTIAL